MLVKLFTSRLINESGCFGGTFLRWSHSRICAATNITQLSYSVQVTKTASNHRNLTWHQCWPQSSVSSTFICQHSQTSPLLSVSSLAPSICQFAKTFASSVSSQNSNDRAAHQSSTLSSSQSSSSNEGSSENAKSEEQIELEKETAEKERQRARQKKFTKYTLLSMVVAFTGSTLYAFFNWGKPEVDETGAVIPDQFSDLPFVTQYAKRAWNTFMQYEKVLKEPTRELLLPPPLPPPYYQPPYTLVLEMTGVLVHPEWTYKTGWRFKKRPFVDYFLHQCVTSSNFEIVIYTQEQGFTAFPLLNSLDPNGYIMYRLFRDSTRYEKGVHIKDLNCLNRDLRTVIHIDWNEKACALNRENCLKLKKWDGDSDDRTLYDLANFLMAIGNEKVEDVRDVIRYYSQFDDPLVVFRENQRKLAEAEKEKEAATKTLSPYRGFGFFRSK